LEPAVVRGAVALLNMDSVSQLGAVAAAQRVGIAVPAVSAPAIIVGASGRVRSKCAGVAASGRSAPAGGAQQAGQSALCWHLELFKLGLE
jgi:uncharacterized membrane protein